MNKVALRIAVSPIVLGLAITGCSTSPTAMVSRAVASSSSAAKPEQRAAHHYEAAQRLVQKNDLAAALVETEKAVELSPRDAGYRMLLGDLYLKNGRFLSAEAAFSDVLTLDPGNSRAMFSLALAEIALGQQYSALVHLDRLATSEAAADLGLAYALAGQPRRAVEMLEPAARAPEADGRVRQNLALAYALSGDWQRARVIASQDLSPVDLTARMEQWASFAQPADQRTQVATLLGATPAEDAGQPVRLALAPVAPEPVAYAEAQPAVAAPEPAARVEAQPAPQTAEPLAYAEAQPAPVAAEPVAYAEASPAPQMAPEAVLQAAVSVAEAPVEAPVKEVLYAKAAKTLITPSAVVEASAPAVPAPVATFTPAPRVRQAAVQMTGSSRFIVQIGAYSSAASIDRAWALANKRFDLGDDYAPLRATVTLPGKGTIHRLSVAGFDSQSEAANTCRSIKAKGGACFVRTLAGDTPIRWASRNNRAG